MCICDEYNLFQNLSDVNFCMKFMTSGFYSSLELMEFLPVLNFFFLLLVTLSVERNSKINS